MPWHRFGLAIGHFTDHAGGTGCTVVRGIDAPFRCAAALVGRASGTRELAVCDPAHLVDRVDAILLTGGSAYGLDAAAGVMRWMEERGRGFSVGTGVVPIVPAAVVFDLAPIGRFDARPDAAAAYAACDGAREDDVAEGAIGAGTGALVGKAAGIEFAMKGGVGIGEARSSTTACAALAVVNAFGDVRDAAGEIVAGARDRDGRFLDCADILRTGRPAPRFADTPAATDAPVTRGHTTLAVIAIDVPVSRTALAQIAQAASAALYRRVTPSGSQFDGDVIFAVAPIGEHNTADADAPPLVHLEALATAALEQAIERGVRTAAGRDGFPGLADP